MVPLVITVMEAHANMGFILSDQAMVQTVWCPVFANGFIVSAWLTRECSVGYDENI